MDEEVYEEQGVFEPMEPIETADELSKYFMDILAYQKAVYEQQLAEGYVHPT